MPTKKFAVIECDRDLYGELATTLQFALVGHPIFYSNSLVDLVKRHCPELYEIADAAGFVFMPSDDRDELAQKPPELWFDVIRKSAAN